MTSLLTPAGLEIPTFDEIVTKIKDELQNQFGADFIVDDESVGGILASVMANTVLNIWQTMLDLYAAQDPAQNIGKQQDDNYALVAIKRITDSKSKAVCQLEGDSGITIPALSIVGVENTADDFENESPITLDQDSAQAVVYQINSPIVVAFAYTITINGTPFVHIATGGDDVDSVSNALVALIDADPDLEAAYSVGPQTFKVNHIKDDVEFSAAISANITVVKVTGLLEFQSVKIGPVVATANKLTVIKTPISGWDSCTNPADARLGTFRESDTAFRTRRQESLLITGRSTLGSLQAQLLQLVGVSGVQIYENVLDVPDAFGLLPHSIQVVIDGGNDQEIWQTILDINTGGIATNGDKVGNATDINGNLQIVRFQRPIILPIFVKVEYKPDPDQITPTNVVSLITNAVVDFGNALGDDKDVIPQHFIRPIYDAIPNGILNLDVEMKADIGDPFSPDVIKIDRGKKSSFASPDVTVIEV